MLVLAERLIEERGPGDMIEQAEVGRVHGRHPVGLVELDRDRMPRA
jgi:hypothetical protein